MTRPCVGCDGPNNRDLRAKYCSDTCRAKSYHKSEKFKAKQKAYRQSERYKSYEQSEKGRARAKAYNQSDKRKASLRAYGQSEKRKAYSRSEKRKASARLRSQSYERRALKRATQYGITVQRLEELLASGCFAPGCETTGGGINGLHIDHDHACCDRTGSCGKCVRGALCSFHNRYLSYLEADWLFAIWAMRQPSLVIKVRREA